MSTVSLYNISGRFYDLMARAAADESLTDDELTEQYEDLCHLLQAKTAGLVGYYRNIEASIVSIDTEIKRLTDLKQRTIKHKDSYKDYIKDCMDRMNIIELSTDLGKLKIAKNPLSLDVLDMQDVPDEYVTATLTIKGDRKRVNDLLELSEKNISLLKLKSEITETADKKAIAEVFKETGECINGIQFNTMNTRLDFK